VEFSEYLSFVGRKLDEAAKKGDKKEWIRLADVLIETIRDQINTLRREEVI